MSHVTDQEHGVNLFEFLQVIGASAVRVRGRVYDPAQFKMLMLLLRRFSKGQPLAVTSTGIQEIEAREEHRAQLEHLFNQIRLYRGVEDRKLTVRQFVEGHLSRKDHALIRRFLLGLFAEMQTADLFEKSKDEILGIAQASIEYSTDQETLDQIESVLEKMYGFGFEMSREAIEMMCQEQRARCTEMLQIGQDVLMGIEIPDDLGILL